MDKFESNSHKSKEEKKIEKVANGTVKKKNEIRKFADVFISEDAGNVGTFILQDILIPAVKKAVSDIVTNGIDMILYGESGRTKKKSSSESYRSYYDRSKDTDRPQPRNPYRCGYRRCRGKCCHGLQGYR